MIFKEEYVKKFEKELGSVDDNVNGMKIKKWIKDNKDIDEYLNEIFQKEPRYGTYSNLIWAFRHRFNIDEHRCKICKKLLTLYKPNVALNHYCNNKCAKSDPIVNQRMKATISAIPNFYKDRHEKIRKTNIERFGVDIPAKSKEIAQKMKDTFSKDPEFWNKRNEKSKHTCIEKYGVENPYNIKEIQQKSNDTHRRQTYQAFSKFKDIIIPLFSEEDFVKNPFQTFKWKCLECGNEFEQEYKKKKFSQDFYNLPRCPICYPVHITAFQKEVYNFVKTFFNDAIENDHQLIKPLEIDISIPKINLAIECDGTYWHSVRFFTYKFNSLNAYHNYHLNKMLKCNEKGYRLIHIWEDEWTKNKEKIKEKLQKIFEGNENLEFTDEEIKLDKSWFNNVSIPNYEFIKEVEPELIQRGKEKVENCGYAIYRKI